MKCNPLNRFRRVKQGLDRWIKDQKVIFCNNPQCGTPIHGDTMIHDASRKNIYHKASIMLH